MDLATIVAKTVQNLPSFDSSRLATLDILFGACLSSRHRMMINQFIPLWNSTFGLVDTLEYSDTLRKVLQRLSGFTEVLLSGVQVRREDIEVSIVVWMSNGLGTNHA